MILTNTESKIINKAYEAFGRETQLLKTIEELGELTRAVARSIKGGCTENLAEEMADVYVTLEYVKKDIPDEMLLTAKKKKIERLRKMIKKLESPKTKGKGRILSID